GIWGAGDEVAASLPYPDVANRHLERVLDGEDDAALGGRIELGQDDPGQADCFVEGLRLAQAVLARRRVEHEDRLRLRARQALVDDAPDLRQLVHEVR